MTRTVAIIGASAGIGRATARMFGARGAHVGLIARGAEGLRGAEEDVTAAGGTALAVQADVTDFDQVDAAATRIEAELGPLDVLRAADHPRRREHLAGPSTKATVLANRLVPGLLDQYLAKTGYNSQQTDKPARAHPPTELASR